MNNTTNYYFPPMATSPPMSNNMTNSTNYTDTTVLKDTLKIYGSIYLVCLVIFCVLQKHFPRFFNIRSWSEAIRCDLAFLPYGYIDWMWKVFWVDDDDIQDQCGMDTLCLLRMLQLGRKLSFMGCLNAIWLTPLYRVNEPPPTTDQTIAYYADPLYSISVIHVPDGSHRLLGTVFASYILFGLGMWLILKEFDWYSSYRDRFLQKRMARNYAVYVSGIPSEYRSSFKLAQYFQRCCNHATDVLEAHCTLHIPNLESLVVKRNSLRNQLERVETLEAMNDGTNMINPCSGDLEIVKHNLRAEIEVLDIEIQETSNRFLYEASKCESIRPLNVADDGKREALLHGAGRSLCSGIVTNESKDKNDDDRQQKQPKHDHLLHVEVVSEDESNLDESQNTEDIKKISTANGVICGDDNNADVDRSQYQDSSISENQDSIHLPVSPPSPYVVAFMSSINEVSPKGVRHHIKRAERRGIYIVKQALDYLVLQGKRFSEISFESFLNIIGLGKSFVGNTMDTAVTIVVGKEEGSPREAGFVVFSKVYAVHCALQMIHHHKPWVMDVTEAPDPDEIFWGNVGLTAKARRLGWLISVGSTTVLCLFWSIPVAFISSLTQVNSLEQRIPGLREVLDRHPQLYFVFAQVAPLLLYLLSQVLLPLILRQLTKWEGHIGFARQEASVFVKMSAFMIIQTFFVSAISGSIFAALGDIIESPAKSVVNLLATSLPQQSSYFMQIAIVFTLTSLAFMMLRVTALFQAWSRTFIGPRITERDKRTTWCALHPLADPPLYWHGQFCAPLVAFFMVLFVYATIAPITCFFLLGCFVLIESIYRLEFFRNFPVRRDSGGRLWLVFISAILLCMVFAQLTLTGFLGLKKAVVAVPMMIPLIIIQMLFCYFITRRHIKVAATLPTGVCLELDRRNEEQELTDFEFVQGRFLQPALRQDNWRSVTEKTEDTSARALAA